MNFLKKIAYRVGRRLMSSAITDTNDLRYLESRIVHWRTSSLRRDQIDGDRYYHGDHDIMFKKRTIIGKNGNLQEVENLPNNRKVDNQYARMVDQKKNYLLGKPISFDGEDKEYIKTLKKIFNKRFQKILKDLGEDAINGGIAWMYPYYGESGELKFKRFPAYEILPFWNDTAHTELDMAVRLYEEEKPDAINEHDTITKVEVYTKNGIDFYTFENNKLIPDVEKPHENYMTVTTDDKTEGYNWDKIPLVAFKANSKEIPLIKKCKSIQDAINDIISTFKNNMDEDTRNTILVLENYDGQDLGEFREKLAQYGVIKTRSGDGARGDVRTLHIEVNYNNYESILRMFRKAMVENCKGYDFSEIRSNNDSPSQMNLKSVYSDIDLDATDMEGEFNASFEDLMWFVNKHFANLGLGDYSEANVELIFNRESVVNEVEVMQMLTNLGVKISNYTLLKQVPFIDSADDEMKLVKKELQEEMEAYDGSIPPKNGDVNDGEEKE